MFTLIRSMRVRGNAMTNDTQVFFAICFDSQTGEMKPVGRAGTMEAIQRDGFEVDPYVRKLLSS
jgi:hypothetical protein